MSKLVWDPIDNRGYESGLDRGVFYPHNGPAQVWNGLVSVDESPSEADEKVRYFDGIRTHSKRKPGYFSGTIEAVTYPQAMDELLGTQRSRSFNLSYRIHTENSYRIHLAYNVLLEPTSSNYTQELTRPNVLSWAFSTRPISLSGLYPTAHLIVEAGTAYPSAIADLEAILYGDETQAARIPSPQEVHDIFEEHAVLRIFDNGDGTWTAIGPDEAITNNPDGSFVIDWPSAVWIDSETYSLRSH